MASEWPGAGSGNPGESSSRRTSCPFLSASVVYGDARALPESLVQSILLSAKKRERS